jgi:hypothetical protein
MSTCLIAFAIKMPIGSVAPWVGRCDELAQKPDTAGPAAIAWASTSQGLWASGRRMPERSLRSAVVTLSSAIIYFSHQQVQRVGLWSGD